MNLKIILKTIRKFALSPILIYSIYLIIIYSNDFWIKMIGPSHLAISIILLASSSIAIYFSILFYGGKDKKVNSEPLYFIFSIVSFVVSISLIYYTRDIKTMESIYWINQFLNANRNTFFVSCFNQLYDSYSQMDRFVHTRIINVHDSLICITIITFIIYIFFTFKFKKVSKIKNLKRPKKIRNKSSPIQTENTNNNEEQSSSVNDNPPFTQIDNNSSPPSEIPLQPWVIPQSDESETSPPVQPWVLPPPPDQDENQQLNDSLSKPDPQPQLQKQPQFQPQGEYEYEYEYDYD